ncbi:MAG: hypothetical protein SFW67_19090 [Myxococcaceae bacterium]|nr:hypothetical protein [Myxococcaceae bacterium]
MPTVVVQDSSDDALEVLVGASLRLGHHTGDLQEALIWSTPAALASVAERLLVLLRDPRFGRLALDDREPLRVTLIEALLRAGYPWALTLSAEDLTYRTD